MTFKRFVQTGRVALVSDGPHRGKLVAIVDVIDQTRVLVDGPETKVPRGPIRLNQLHLTKYRFKFPYTASTRIVRKEWKLSKIDEKWKSSIWAQKLENKKKRASMSDFDRFKLRRARKGRNHIRTMVFRKLKRDATHDGLFGGRKKLAKGAKKTPQKPRPKFTEVLKARYAAKKAAGTVKK